MNNENLIQIVINRFQDLFENIQFLTESLKKVNSIQIEEICSIQSDGFRELYNLDFETMSLTSKIENELNDLSSLFNNIEVLNRYLNMLRTYYLVNFKSNEINNLSEDIAKDFDISEPYKDEEKDNDLMKEFVENSDINIESNPQVEEKNQY